MASVIDICNLALSNIRAGSINSLDEASIQAQQCNLKYPFLRDQLLRDAPWQFAHKIKALALLTDELFNWAYVYQYPSDCIRINKVHLNWTEVAAATGSFVKSRYYDRGLPRPNLDTQVEYKIYNIDGNKVIAANESELRIDYIANVTDPNLFDSQFILALGHLLAAELAISLVGGEQGAALRQQEFAIYQQYIEAAVASDMNEQFTETPDSDFISVRS